MAETLDEEEVEGKTKRGGKSFLSVLLKILKYMVFIIVLTMFIIVVSVITIRVLQSQNNIQNSQNRLSLDIQQSVPEDLDWYSTLGEIRGNLLDENIVSFVVSIYIGYLPGDQGVLQELIRRNVQIKERLTLYFTTQYQSDIQGARNLIRMKNELREIINRMMNNKIREVAFDNLQIIPF